MKQFISLMIFIAMFLGNSQLAKAGTFVGNGGLVLKCTAGQKVRLLDFFEAETFLKVKVIDPPGETYQHKIEYIVRRVGSKFPKLAQMLRVASDDFDKNTQYIDGVRNRESGDSYYWVWPTECDKPQQIATQGEALLPGLPKYVIDRGTFNEADEFTKAGIKFHEMLFSLGLARGLTHSRAIRFLVGLMFSEEFYKIADNQWIPGFVHSLLPFYETAGIKIPLFSQDLKLCSPAPGEADCKQSVPVAPAKIQYDEFGRLSAVNYAYDQMISIVGKANSYELNTSYFSLVRKGDVQIQTKGTLFVTSEATDSFYGINIDSRFELAGWLSPARGIICSNGGLNMTITNKIAEEANMECGVISTRVRKVGGS